MRLFNSMGNRYVLLIIVILTAIWIAFNGKNKLYEIRFLIISFLGAEGLNILLKNIFHRLGSPRSVYTFPSGEVLMSVVVYGSLVYMVVKRCKRTWINSVIIGGYLSLCFFIGLSIVYFNTEFPSDVAAGFEFGVEWLSLSIILLEIYRVLSKARDFNATI